MRESAIEECVTLYGRSAALIPQSRSDSCGNGGKGKTLPAQTSVVFSDSGPTGQPASSSAWIDLFFADVFFPDFGMLDYVFRQQLDAFLGVEVNDFDAILAQLIDSALKVYRLAHDDRSDAKLTYQSTAIPIRSEGRNHGFVAIGSLAVGAAKGVRFAVR